MPETSVSPDEPLYARRRLIHGAGACLFLSVLPLGASAAVVSAVRVWPASEYTRVTLEHDNDLKFNYFVIDNPDRLVVDIEGIDLNGT
ncbi:MAG: AMIN domain-containing protein, partial [Burkholderiales bacterium]